MTATEQRPVPLPNRPAGTGGADAGKSDPKPVGAARMANLYVDAAGRPRTAPHPVPVDGNDRRTAHIRHTCRGHVEDTTRHPDGRQVATKKPCGHVLWLLPDAAAAFCPAHGKRLTPESTPAGEVLREFVSTAYAMHGAATLPWAVYAANVAAGVVVEATSAPAGEVALAVPAMALAGFVVAKHTLTARAVRRGRLERGEKTGRRVRAVRRRSGRVAAVGAGSGVWWTAAAVVDPATWAGRVVWAASAAVWAVGAYPWWRSVDRRKAEVAALAVKAKAPVAQIGGGTAPPDAVQVRAASTWATRIGCGAGPLAGTDLVEFKRLPACDAGGPGRVRLPNWSAKVVAKDPGSINMREYRPMLLGRIAAAYGCTYGDVSFTADDSDLSVAYVRVQPDNVLAEVRMWQGPQVVNDWGRGRSMVGRFDDGGDVLYQWWTKTGAVHDLVSGCTGSGKSEFVAQLILDSLHSGGRVLDWVGDPQGGQSYGQLKDEVDWFARDLSEIRFMLLAAKKEMLRRNDELSAANVKTWQPTADMPLLVITLDEIQSYIQDPAILALVTDLVGQGRKCGIKMRLITQIPAAYNLGDSTYIKEQLKAGQTFIFRAADDIAARSAMDGDCPVNPMDLPRRWGAGTCAVGDTTAGLLFVQGIHGRDVYGRVDWTGDDMRRWLVDGAGGPSRTPGVFCEAAQLESGVLWGDRAERARKALLAGRSDADLLPGGKAVELIAAASAERVGSDPLAVEVGRQAAPEAVRARDAVLAAAREVAAAGGGGLVAKARVVEVLKSMPESTRDNAFTELVAKGDLRRVRHGQYEVAV
jgi:hypothetical protein